MVFLFQVEDKYYRLPSILLKDLSLCLTALFSPIMCNQKEELLTAGSSIDNPIVLANITTVQFEDFLSVYIGNRKVPFIDIRHKLMNLC
jgi:hypothetical protein